MEDTIILIRSETYLDEFKIQKHRYEEREVLCEIQSASRSEFYQAAAAGLHPEMEVSLFIGDYDGETAVKYNGTYYHVIRSYRTSRNYKTTMNESDSDRIILTVEKKTGDFRKWAD